MTQPNLLLRTAISVRWGDMDAFQHVNNAAYSTYLEEARLVWFNKLGGTWLDAGQAPVIANLRIDFRRPIIWPSTIMVSLYAGRIGRSSALMPFQIHDQDQSQILYAEGDTTLVWIDPTRGQSVPLPEVVRHALSNAPR